MGSRSSDVRKRDDWKCGKLNILEGHTWSRNSSHNSHITNYNVLMCENLLSGAIDEYIQQTVAAVISVIYLVGVIGK